MTAIRAQRFLRSLSVIASVVVLAAAFAGWAYYQHLNGNLHRGDLNLGDHRLPAPTPNAAGQTPLNILVIGTDSRGTAANVRLGGARNDAGRPGLADVEMLVHVAADRGSMTVLSIPRDTRVTIPACTDPATGKRYPQTEDIINASLQNGGPGCTVATWEQLTGIPVDHFMMADFSGVVNLADAIGGVPVCVDHNIHDPESGLRLPQGTSYVQGQQALQWLRTRHGFEDGSDIGRYQQLVREVIVAPPVQDYAIRLVMATHPGGPFAQPGTNRYIRCGASPRGAQAIVLASKVRALLEGRFNVSFEDVKKVYLPALRHRIMLNFEAQAENIPSDVVLEEILKEVKERVADAPSIGRK